MPAKSKQQFKFMKGICEGSIKHRKGLPSKKVACEFVKGQSPKGLPKKKSNPESDFLKYVESRKSKTRKAKK